MNFSEGAYTMTCSARPLTNGRSVPVGDHQKGLAESGANHRFALHHPWQTTPNPPLGDVLGQFGGRRLAAVLGDQSKQIIERLGGSVDPLQIPVGGRVTRRSLGWTM
jgi:hypothetical protein